MPGSNVSPLPRRRALPHKRLASNQALGGGGAGQPAVTYIEGQRSLPAQRNEAALASSEQHTKVNLQPAKPLAHTASSVTAGQLTRDFKHTALDFSTFEEDGQKKLRVDCHFGKRKSLAVMRTTTSHITNLITGVTKVGTCNLRSQARVDWRSIWKTGRMLSMRQQVRNS